MSDAASPAPALVRVVQGRRGLHAALANPRKLNPLSLQTIRELQSVLDGCVAARCAGHAQALLLEGDGRAFCAGGDVRSLYDARLNTPANSDGSDGGSSGGSSALRPASMLAVDYFFEEYTLVHSVARLWFGHGIPQVSLWHGIVMGGGVGLSGHGRYRVCCEKTVFAMPETRIGFFPDVGVTQLLCSLDYEVGMYVAMTGARLQAADLMWTGLATHFCPEAELPALRAELLEIITGDRGCRGSAADSGGESTTDDGAAVTLSADAQQRALADAVDACIDRHCTRSTASALAGRGVAEDVLAAPAAGGDGAVSPLPPSQLAAHVATIRACFGEPTVERIVAKLRGTASEAPSSASSATSAGPAPTAAWAAHTADLLETELSPTSLKVTLALMQRVRAGRLTLGQSLQLDYRLAQKFCAPEVSWPRPQQLQGEFMEGVRAALVDKDRAPQWDPCTLAAVPAGDVEAFFEPLPRGHGRGELVLSPVQDAGVGTPTVGTAAGAVPFRIRVPDADIADLRRRLRHTRWPDAELTAGWNEGVPRQYLQEVCRYWSDEFDWRVWEAKLNAWPQFTAEVDGHVHHFFHVRSKAHPDARPLLLTHGWPGSQLEFHKVVDRLVNPTAFGGTAADAFHVVMPSLPGYGFGAKPSRGGWDVTRIARAFARLMTDVLGYDRYFAQGGDWGSMVTQAVAMHDPEHCAGAHVNMVPLPGISRRTAVARFGPLTQFEEQALDDLDHYNRDGNTYALQQRARPQTLGYALADSPAGQCAWVLEKFCAWTDCRGHPENALTRDEMLANISVYWFANAGASSARLYNESFGGGGSSARARRRDRAQQTRQQQPGRGCAPGAGSAPTTMSSPSSSPPPPPPPPPAATKTIAVPMGCAIYPREIFRASRRWAEPFMTNIVHWKHMPRGGHFAAFEQPALFVEDLRECFRAMSLLPRRVPARL